MPSSRNLKAHLAGLGSTAFGLTGTRKIGTAIARNRAVLAYRYLRGHGLEFGALGRPLLVPPWAAVRYVDRLSSEGLTANYKLQKIAGSRVDLVDDAQTMATLANESQDFVIANHVLEHLEDPIRFFANAARVLRPAGILFMALPNKEESFDRDRPVTPFEHLIDDYENGPQASRRAHFEEFVMLADLPVIGRQAWKTDAEREILVHRLMDDDYSIHFHVWDAAAILEMLARTRREFAVPLDPEAVVRSADEIISILRRS